MEYLELNPQSDRPQSSTSNYDDNLKNGSDSESDIEILEEVPFTPPVLQNMVSPKLSMRERDVSANSETKSNESGFGSGEEIVTKNDIPRFVQFLENLRKEDIFMHQ